MSANDRTADYAFAIEAVDGGFVIKVVEGNRDPETIGTLKGSGQGVVFEPVRSKMPTVTASPGNAPGHWDISYAVIDRNTGRPEQTKFEIRGGAKVDRTLRHIAAYLEVESDKRGVSAGGAPPRRLTYDIAMSPDVKRLETRFSEAGGVTRIIVFSRV